VALDIGIADGIFSPAEISVKVAFDDDANYWFCYPFFEALQRKTGQLIDLYGGAWFHGDSLSQLAECLTALKSQAMALPEEWDQCAGHSIGSRLEPTEPIPIYKKGNRRNLIALLDSFIELADEARKRDKWVGCLGD
jgi:hypothetical protein